MDLVIYSICFVIGLAFAIATGLRGELFGAPADDSADAHAEPPSVSALSPFSITAFFAAFGAAGLILRKLEPSRNLAATGIFAVLCAFAVSGIVYWFLNRLLNPGHKHHH